MSGMFRLEVEATQDPFQIVRRNLAWSWMAHKLRAIIRPLVRSCCDCRLFTFWMLEWSVTEQRWLPVVFSNPNKAAFKKINHGRVEGHKNCKSDCLEERTINPSGVLGDGATCFGWVVRLACHSMVEAVLTSTIYLNIFFEALLVDLHFYCPRRTKNPVSI